MSPSAIRTNFFMSTSAPQREPDHDRPRTGRGGSLQP
jgi:hypothetical protein